MANVPAPGSANPVSGKPILLASPDGCRKPCLTRHVISLNGKRPDDYESFVLEKEPRTVLADRRDPNALSGFCKTEYRPYDAVVVSILHVARTVAPDAIAVSSDGGDMANPNYADNILR